MVCNGVLTAASKSKPPPVLKFFIPLLQSSNCLLPPLRLEIAASAFFTHDYLEQANVHISEAITTD